MRETDLYALQADPSAFNPTLELGLARLNLKTGTVESWALTGQGPLPEHQGGLTDIAIVNGQTIVTLFWNGSGEDDI